LLDLVIVIVTVIVIPLSLALCFFLLRRRRLRRSCNQDQESNASSVEVFFSLFNGKAKKPHVFPFTVAMPSSPRNISYLSEKGMAENTPSPHRHSRQEEAFRSDSRRIPVENPNEAIMTSEAPFQSPNDGDVSNLPEKVGVEARAAVETNLQRQMSVLQDRLSELHAAQEIASRSSSLDDSHPSAVHGEEISVLRQLVEDLRMVTDTLRARSRRISGLTLGTLGGPPPQYQTG
jgi:hypothetical protein